tara:strand:+ start:195 stop:1076 length:882 start_codon:yes stop_codon:yes gene_type:complete
MKKNCLLFGASGFIGSHVSDALQRRNYNIIASDKIKGSWISKNVNFVKIDITKEAQLKKIKSKVDFIIIFSAISDIGESNQNPNKTVKTNVVGLLNILNLAKKLKVKKIIFASTVYVNSSKGGFYKSSKIAGESLIKEFKNLYNLNYTIIRFGSVYGPRSSINNGIYKILYNALKKKKIEYFGSSENIREYIHVLDAAEATCDLMDKKFDNQIITLTGRESTKVKDLLLMLKDIMSIKKSIKFSKKNLPGHYIRTPYNLKDDLSRKYSPQLHVDLAQGLVQTINFIKKENKIK